MGEAVDAVAHHEPHGAGIIIGPYRLRTEFALRGVEAGHDFVQRLIPGDALELARALRPDAALRIEQPVGMMDALGIARDLGADDARGVALQLGAAHPPDPFALDHLDIQSAGRRAVVRTGGMADVDPGVLIHGRRDSTEPPVW